MHKYELYNNNVMNYLLHGIAQLEPSMKFENLGNLRLMPKHARSPRSHLEKMQTLTSRQG